MTEKNSKKTKDTFRTLKRIIVILLIVLIAVLCIFGYRFGRDLFSDKGLTDKETAVGYTLIVEDGDSTMKVGEKLVSRGIISSSLVFFAQSKLYKCKITAGEYPVDSSMSSKAILKYLHQEYEKKKAENDGK